MNDDQQTAFLARVLAGLIVFLCIFWPVYFVVYCGSASIEQKSYEKKFGSLPVETIPWAELERIYGRGGIYEHTDYFAAQDRKREDWKRYEGRRVRWSGEVVGTDEQAGWPSIIVKFSRDSWTGDVEVVAEYTRSGARRRRDERASAGKDIPGLYKAINWN